MKRKCLRCGRERAYSADSTKCLAYGASWSKRRETAAERDERIVTDSKWEVDMGVVVAYQDDDDPMENMRACEAAVRILNRIRIARKGRGR